MNRCFVSKSLEYFVGSFRFVLETVIIYLCPLTCIAKFIFPVLYSDHI